MKILVSLPIISSLIQNTPPEMIIDVEISFLIKVPMGILDHGPLKSVVGKQSVEQEASYHEIWLVDQIFHNVNQSDDLQMLE